MIPIIICASVVAAVAFLAGSLWGGIGMVNKLEAAEESRSEYKRRLNRILETERPGIEAHPKLVMIYDVARGARV